METILRTAILKKLSNIIFDNFGFPGLGLAEVIPADFASVNILYIVEFPFLSTEEDTLTTSNSLEGICCL